MINIIDDDSKSLQLLCNKFMPLIPLLVVSIGFEQTIYTVSEEAGSIDVCIEVKQPAVINLLVALSVETEDGTAKGK